MVRGIAPKAPLAFKLAIRKVTKSGGCENPTVDARPIDTTAEAIQAAYEWFGIKLGKTEEVLVRGYAALKALREETFKRYGKMYVVNDVGAWIAFSNVVDMSKYMHMLGASDVEIGVVRSLGALAVMTDRFF